MITKYQEKWIEVVSHLTELTHDGKLEWVSGGMSPRLITYSTNFRGYTISVCMEKPYRNSISWIYAFNADGDLIDDVIVEGIDALINAIRNKSQVIQLFFSEVLHEL